MRKMKKFLSLLLVVVFALSMMIPTASAAQFSDVDSTYRYYNAVENLAALNIINGMGDGTFAPDKIVKRSEFAKIVCIGIVKTGEIGPTAGAGFTDVAADHWASGYIKVAAAAGIINGMGDGTFAPDADVTYEQAVKMLVCALGYDAQAQARGGYPNGYITVAGTLKLLREIVDGTVGKGAHRGLIAKLVDNALNVKIVDPLTGKTSDSVSSIDKTKTKDGQVISIYGTTLEYGEESPCKRDQMEIDLGGDVKIFSIEELDIDPNEWLGKYVTIYYEADSSRDYQELTNIREMAASNYETVISLSDVSLYDDATVEYMTEDEEYEEIDVNRDAIIMLNGSPIDTESKTLSDILDANINESGTIRFLDAEGEGSASIVFFMVYDTIVVNSITKNEFKVYDKIVNGKTEILDEDSRSQTITFTKDGKPAEFSNITTNNILSIAKNEAKDKIDVLISTSTVSGTISEIEEDCMTFVINNKTYKVAKSYESEAKKLFANDVAVKLYLDAFGKVAFAEISASATNYKYAYLVGAESSGGTEEEFKIKVYNLSTSSNISPTYLSINLDDGVRINGERMRDSDSIKTALLDSAAKLNKGAAAYDDEAEEYTQIIKYSLDGVYVDKIITYTGAEPDRNNANVLNIDNLEADELVAQTTSKLGKYSIAGSALVIPADRVNDKYVGKSATSYTQGGKYKVQLVDATAGNSVKAVLIYGANTSLASTSMRSAVPVIVTKVTGTATVEGEDGALNVLKVKTITGEEKTYYSKGEEEYKKFEGASTNKWSSSLEVPAGEGNFKGIKPGDVIKVVADEKNILEEVMIVAKAEDVISGDQEAAIASEGSNLNLLNAQYRYFLGTARLAENAQEGNTLVLTAMYPDDENWDVEDDDESYIIGESIKIIVVDTEANEAKIATEGAFGDILGYNTETEKPSKLFIYQTAGSIKAIVIFKYPEE